MNNPTQFSLLKVFRTLVAVSVLGMAESSFSATELEERLDALAEQNAALMALAQQQQAEIA